jgi:hypothetical protein
LRGSTTRKWRRKPLESLKTDSEIGAAWLQSLGGRTDQANSVLLLFRQRSRGSQHAMIMDVEAMTAIRQAEVGAAKSP